MKRPPRFISLMVGMTLIIIGISQLVGFAITQLMPAPDTPQMQLTQAITALQDPSAATRFGLVIHRSSEPPDGYEADLIARTAAPELHQPLSVVHAAWITRKADPHILKVTQVSSVDDDPPGNGPRQRTLGPFSEMKEETDIQGISEALLLPGLPLPAFQLSVRQSDGLWLTVGPSMLAKQRWRMHMIGAFVLSDLLLVPLAWWLSRRLTRPLKTFAEGAERASLVGEAMPIRLEGPHEIRVAATAMNAMLARLHAQTTDMTRMLAAVAHDLRTPLTSLRLRAETAPPEQCARMVSDIERMKTMITQVLNYAQGQTHPEAKIPLDLRALIYSTVAEAQSLGGHVFCAAIPPVTLTGEALGLRRALANLIENAVRYGGSAHVSVQLETHQLSIQIEDDGPGIPADQVERLQQPFQRMESSRSADTGGVGLGLAVACSAAERHGGRVILRNRECGGLCAQIVLPREAPLSSPE